MRSRLTKVSEEFLAFLVIFALSMVAASDAHAQFGLGVKRPNIANIFHPVVGSGAVYERTDRDGKTSPMELSIVDSEMVGTQQGYWMEVGHSDPRSKELMYGKTLITPGDFKIHKAVFLMPGSAQPMLMEMDAGRSHRDDMEKNLDKWHSVGTESITVPAGTFSCEHWTKDEGKGDVWVSSKVSPFGMVKSVDNGETMVLTKLITGAKSHITGTPVKFDPQLMRQQMQKNRQEP